MSKTPQNIPNWKQKLAAQLRRDKKKTAILSVLVLTALAVGGRLLLKKASASSKAPATVKALSPTGPTAPVNQTAAGAPVKNKTAPADSAGHVRRGQHRLVRDVFMPNPVFFARPGKAKSEKTPGGKTKTREELLKERVRKEAEALALTSTIVGDRPIATINGRLLCKSDWLKGFTVVEITEGRCTLVKEGVTVRLTTKARKRL